MQYVIAIFIFCFVLFCYLHIYFHLKTSSDLEVYTIERPSKAKLEEICDLRQPVIFDYKNDALVEAFNLEAINKNYGSFDINLRNNTDHDSDLTELYLPLQLSEVTELLKKDSEAKYFTENNSEFLKETGLLRVLRNNDMFLRPPLVSSCMHDFSTGATNCVSPLRYTPNYRHFIYITHGQVTIKLIPPSGSKYLRPISDYDNFEFRSPINPWNVQDEYKRDFGKIKALEINLKQSEIIFIPAYWWYSVKYGDEETSICSFRYRTYMNTVAILPSLVIYLLQSLNTKYANVAKIE